MLVAGADLLVAAGKAKQLTQDEYDASFFPASSGGVSSWNDLTDRPTSFPPTAHAHGNITSAGAIGTVAERILITDTDGLIVTSAVGAGMIYEDGSIVTDIPYIKTQLSTVATTGSYSDLSNKPTIPSAYSLPTATASVLGGIKIGSGLSIDGSGVVTAAGTYTLPAATVSILGGRRIIKKQAESSGTVTVSYGTSSSTACAGNDARLSDARTPTAHTQAWSTITSTPTTLAGYGITDAARAYSRRFAWSSPYSYSGRAASGSATSASVWTIKRTQVSTSGAITATLTATNVAWDNYATATYS